MRNWSTACPDWEERIVKKQSLVTCPILFPEVADYAIENIFKELKIVDMVGHPTIGEITRPWVYDLAGPFFGSLADRDWETSD